MFIFSTKILVITEVKFSWLNFDNLMRPSVADLDHDLLALLGGLCGALLPGLDVLDGRRLVPALRLRLVPALLAGLVPAVLCGLVQAVFLRHLLSIETKFK
jgi:hypothetical protein